MQQKGLGRSSIGQKMITQQQAHNAQHLYNFAAPTALAGLVRWHDVDRFRLNLRETTTISREVGIIMLIDECYTNPNRISRPGGGTMWTDSDLICETLH